jgi:hypothetical protein
MLKYDFIWLGWYTLCLKSLILHYSPSRRSSFKNHEKSENVLTADEEENEEEETKKKIYKSQVRLDQHREEINEENEEEEVDVTGFANNDEKCMSNAYKNRKIFDFQTLIHKLFPQLQSFILQF